MNKKYLLMLSILLVSSLIMLTQAWANFSIQPSRIEGTFPQGRSYSNVFDLINPADKPARVHISWEDRTINPSKKDWFSLEKSSIEIPPGGTVKVKYTISIPKDATGEYNAWAVFTGAKFGNLMGAKFKIRRSIPIYIGIRNTEKYNFEIQNINIAPKVQSHLSFNIKLLNTGNVHIRPTGTIEIISLDRNNESYILPFNDIAWAIIPNESNEYLSKFKEDQKLLNGKYKAIINISAGTGDRKKELSHEIEFTVTDGKYTITKGQIVKANFSGKKKQGK